MSELTQPATLPGTPAPGQPATLPGTPAPGQPGYSTEQPAAEGAAEGKAAETAQAGKQAASEVAQTAADSAKNVAQETKTQARNLASEARNQLLEQSGVQHKNLVNNLRSLADELGSMAQKSEQSGPATDVVGQVSDRAHSAASWLDDREPGQLVDELRSLARRKPAAFLVGALAAGVVAGRLTRGVKDVHSDDSGDTNVEYGSARPVASGTEPAISAPIIDTQQLPTSGASYPPAAGGAAYPPVAGGPTYPPVAGDAAYPPPLPTERSDEPGGGRW